MTAWTVGDRAVWRHELRGGYGYTERIDVTIERVGRTRATVRAPLKDGGSKVVVVKFESLRKENQ